MSDEPFLSRWSRKKAESKAGTAGPTAESVPVPAGTQFEPTELPGGPVQPPEPLPPIESLTPESDFTPFMKADVDPGLKRQAFKKLIEDPQFNVMDGLDVYIDDYSKPDPLPAGWLEKMNQVKHLGIFKPAQEEASGTAETAALPEPAPLQKAIAEQPLVEGEAPLPADTSAAEIPPSKVGKTGRDGEGISDVVV